VGLPTLKFNACQQFVKCPVNPGTTDANTTLEVPFLTPSGVYQGKITGLDAANHTLVCIQFNATVA